MTDKHPKRPRDPNQLAKAIIDRPAAATTTDACWLISRSPSGLASRMTSSTPQGTCARLLQMLPFEVSNRCDALRGARPRNTSLAPTFLQHTRELTRA